MSLQNIIHKKKSGLACALSLFCLFSCNNLQDINQPIDSRLQKTVEQDAVLDTNYIYQYGELMFKDDEPREIYLSKHRSFYTDQMITANLYANSVVFMDTVQQINFAEIDSTERVRLMGKVRVFNAVSADISDVDIFCEITPLHQTIHIAKIELLPKHYLLNFPFNLAHGSQEFKTVNGDTILIDDLESYSPNDFRLYIESSDETFQKLNTIKVTTLCNFKDYDWPLTSEFPVDNWETNNWGRTYPVHCRRYTSSIANIGHHVSQDYFIDELLEYAAQDVVTLHGGGCEEDADGNRVVVPTTSIVDVQNMYDAYISKAKIFYGVCEGPSGLGGGNVLGVSSNQVIFEAGAQVNPGSTWAHEMGHCLGYGHSSNMTYSDNLGGFTIIWREIFTRHEAERVLIGGEIIYPQEYEMPVSETVSSLGLKTEKSHVECPCCVE